MLSAQCSDCRKKAKTTGNSEALAFKRATKSRADLIDLSKKRCHPHQKRKYNKKKRKKKAENKKILGTCLKAKLGVKRKGYDCGYNSFGSVKTLRELLETCLDEIRKGKR